MKTWIACFWLALAPAAFAQDAIWPPAEAQRAEVNVLVVRHALNACGDLQCALTEQGDAQATALAQIVAQARAAGLQVQGVFASSACRTILTATPTANEANLPVLAYPARDTAPVCGYLGQGAEFPRPTAAQRPAAGLGYAIAPASSRTALQDVIAQAADRSHRRTQLYIVVDHSNFVCTWLTRFGAPESDYAGECNAEGLQLTDYSDAYWLYDTDRGAGAAWRVKHVENAFSAGADDPAAPVAH